MINAAAIIWYIATIVRVILVFWSFLDRKTFIYILPTTYMINLTQTVIVQKLSERELLIQLVIIAILIPPLLLTQLRYTQVVSLSFNVLIYGIVTPLFKGLSLETTVPGLLASIFSALFLIIFEKKIVMNIWNKLKRSLANDELL